MSLKISIDFLDNETIRGWAVDIDNTPKKLTVNFLIGNELLGSTIANQFREDLAKKNIGDGYCAFQFMFPFALKDEVLKEKLRLQILDHTSQPKVAIEKFLENKSKFERKRKDITVFNHIPKTAGSTIRSILAQNYSGTVYEFFGDLEQYKRFQERTEFHAEKYDLIHGHVPYGIHHGLGEVTVTNCLTFLRDPIKRFFSEYFFGFYPEGGLYQKITQDKMSLSDYIQGNESVSYLNNLYLKYVAGYHPVEECNLNETQLLNKAKERLENDFILCGITEFFDESILIMAKLLGWLPPIYVRKNVSNIKPLPYIPQKTISQLKERFSSEYKLYDYAQELLKETIIQQPPSFWEALKEMKHINQELNQDYDYEENRIYTIKHGIDKVILDKQRSCQKILAYLKE